MPDQNVNNDNPVVTALGKVETAARRFLVNN